MLLGQNRLYGDFITEASPPEGYTDSRINETKPEELFRF